ncbi:MAG: cyclic nucleotide-binding domain-containing protein [Legionellaceae bacterium]|nr:cyclic nucleotide-binding domain-containing protein [Legionellaceae bacterium]
MAHDALIGFLTTIPYFQTLPLPVIKKIAAKFDPIYIQGGQVLMNEGDPGNCLYIVQSGRLRAFKALEDEREEILGDVYRGELIGELALFTEAPRVATVIAIRDSMLWKLSKSAFDVFVQQNPIHIMPMVKSTILRLLHPSTHRAGDCKVIAVAPAGRSPLNKDLMNALIDEYARIGPTKYLNLDTVQAQFPTMDLKSSHSLELLHSTLADWLSAQECNHQHLIYEVDSSNLHWTHLCIRQADKIILVGEGSDSAELGEIEHTIFSSQSKIPVTVELVLLHEPSISMPKNTHHWLQKREVQVHHTKKGNANDIKRLARLISGGEISLVLGGGGARSLGHIGVYKALKEFGIPIDRFGGASMGSIIAAALAMELSIEDMINTVTDYMIKNRKFNDYTIPTTALLGGAGWLEVIQKVYGEQLRIEDLWRSFFCVASNFTLRKMEIIQSGLVYKAVRASVSLPGIVPPISNEHDELLVDGGIFNNLPVDVMRNVAPSSRIIAVRVSPSINIHAHIPNGIASGLKRFLWGPAQTENPLENNVPGIADIIAGSVSMCNDEKEEKMLLSADYQLDMDFSKYPMLDFSKLPELIELGYTKTMEQLSKNPIMIGRSRADN